LVEFHIDKGVHGLFICGTHGSGPIMAVEERKPVHQIVVDQAKGRITVVAHIATTSTEQSVELAGHAESVGADCVASISPYYHRPDERTVADFFRTLAKAVDLPAYIYNNPRASGVAITPSFLCHLADVGVQGVKDSGFSFIELTHFMLANALRFPMMFLGGVFLPVASLPSGSRLVARALPLTYALEALSAAADGCPLATVALDLISLVASTIVLFGLSVRTMARRVA